MQIVIDIPKGLYEHVKEHKDIFTYGLINGEKIGEIIANGTVLPEQARIIDMDKLAITPIDITDLPHDRCLMVYYPEDLEDATIFESREDGET